MRVENSRLISDSIRSRAVIRCDSANIRAFATASAAWSARLWVRSTSGWPRAGESGPWRPTIITPITLPCTRSGANSRLVSSSASTASRCTAVTAWASAAGSIAVRRNGLPVLSSSLMRGPSTETWRVTSSSSSWAARSASKADTGSSLSPSSDSRLIEQKAFSRLPTRSTMVWSSFG